ncbi:LacI family DNA-binding transcriptional regulator [Sphingomonas sp. PL-96]|uniref:LacI family DNA-binding transcriptional regulator n=1 Tax=Sphingomonas sp. PL-96 TaxID=2887201 RepID=UPI001E56DA96|nr:LacI family DNA-binding transcriptional regulator [Sphingomonas sp. PL-96]MCC2978008.1 LacI family DNA-binding transcriptional regulator [Sphingomonas sp. PL-96]
MSLRRPTSIDVAREAQVSQSAVSRTFTPGASVSPATRAKVLAAATKLGYQPNMLPRLLQNEQTGIVAIVTGDLSHPFYAEVLGTLTAALRQAGRMVMLVNVDSDTALDAVVADLTRYRVDAVVSALAVQTRAAADTIAAMRTPVIQLAHGVRSKGIWTVNVDNHAVGRQAADLLLARGGSRFGYLAGPDTPTQRRREQGYVARLRDLGHAVVVGRSASFTHRGGFDAATRLLSAEPINALFCVNDLVACGAIDAAHQAELAVPAGLRIAGVDNIVQADWPGYALTSFDQQVDQLTSLVVATVSDLEASPAEQLIPPQLVERRSTLVGVA